MLLPRFERRFKEGSSEPLPVASIQHDASTTYVSAYDYPFVHERILKDISLGRRFPGKGGFDLDGEEWFWRNFELYQDEDGRLGVMRPQERYNMIQDAEAGFDQEPGAEVEYTGALQFALSDSSAT